MLGDIEEVATEALLHGFAPAALALAPDSALGQRLLYQQFALLHAKLMSREFEDAMALILANPHRAWIEEREEQHPGRPLRSGGHLSRALARSGPGWIRRDCCRSPLCPVVLSGLGQSPRSTRSRTGSSSTRLLVGVRSRSGSPMPSVR